MEPTTLSTNLVLLCIFILAYTLIIVVPLSIGKVRVSGPLALLFAVAATFLAYMYLPL